MLLRLILACAPPEFRRTYEAQIKRDLLAAFAEHGHGSRYIIRGYLDLCIAVAMESTSMLLHQLNVAVRSFVRTPAITVIMILTLGLGIGANVAAFAVASGVLLHPLPFSEADRMVRVHRMTWINSFHCTSCPSSAFLSFAYRDRNSSFSALAPFQSAGGVVTGLGSGQPPRTIYGAVVGAQFFDVVATRPARGRPFEPADEKFGAPGVLVISHQFWQRALHADPNVLGRTLFFDGRAKKIVGVLAPEFVFPSFSRIGSERPPFYAVLQRRPGLRPGNNAYGIVARLKPGVTLEHAQADLTGIQTALAQADRRSFRGDGVRVDQVRVVSLSDDLFGRLRPLLLTFVAAVLVVLLIACFNVANLLLARAVARQRDLTIRLALGATARHIVGQMTIESVMLAVVSTALGLAVGYYAILGYVRLAPPGIHRLDQITIDWRVFLYALAIAAVTALITSLVPAAVASRSSLAATLKTGDRAARGGANFARSGLVVGQIACAFALVVSCGLLVRSVIALNTTNLGYETAHLVEVSNARLVAARYPTAERKIAFYRSVASRIAAVPGIESVAYGSNLPMDGNSIDGTFTIVGHALSRAPDADFSFVSPGYFATLGLRFTAGHDFSDRDGPHTQPVVIVNAEFAKRFLPDGALGKHIIYGGGPLGPRTIVGVVPTFQTNEVGETPTPTMYFPSTQGDLDSGTDAAMLVRTRVPLETLANSIAEAWRADDRTQPVPVVASVAAYVSAQAAPARASATLLGALAVLGLIFAVSGTASVVAYAVARRTNEIGIRIALGARTGAIVFAMLRGATVMTVLGIAIGLILAALAAQALSDQLYETKPFDPITYVSVALLLALATFAASAVPAYRASRIDPAVALRYE